jgi:hypothetical protein
MPLFTHASNLSISGGEFTNIQGDSFTTINLYFIGEKGSQDTHHLSEVPGFIEPSVAHLRRLSQPTGVREARAPDGEKHQVKGDNSREFPSLVPKIQQGNTDPCRPVSLIGASEMSQVRHSHVGHFYTRACSVLYPRLQCSLP